MEELIMSSRKFNNGFMFKDGQGCLELFVNERTVQGAELRKVEVENNGQKEERSVLSLNGMSGVYAGPSNVKNVLGEDVVNEEGLVFVNGSIWGKGAEAIAPHIRKGMILRVYGKFGTEEYTNKDGETRKGVRASIYRLEVAYWGKDANADSDATTADAEPAATEAPADEAEAVAVPF